MTRPLAPRGPSAAQLLHAAVRQSAAQLDPALRAQLGDADTQWALALVLGVWAGLPVLPSGWLKDAIAAGIAPYRQVDQAQPVVRAAWAAGSARNRAQLASASRSLAAGFQSLGSDALGMLLGSPEFANLRGLVRQGAPRAEGLMAGDELDFDDEEIPFEGEERDVPIAPTGHTELENKGPWVNPGDDGSPTEGLDWTKVITKGLDTVTDVVKTTTKTSSDYQKPPGQTGSGEKPPKSDPPPSEPPDEPRRNAPAEEAPPRSAPPPASQGKGAGLLLGLLGAVAVVGGVAAMAGGRRKRSAGGLP